MCTHLEKVKVLVAQLCLTLCDPVDCSPPGSSVHVILQTRILEWIAIPFSRGSSLPSNQILVSCIEGKFFTVWATGKSCRDYVLFIFLPFSFILKNYQYRCIFALMRGIILYFLTFLCTLYHNSLSLFSI